jgi:hypothetical protein
MPVCIWVIPVAILAGVVPALHCTVRALPHAVLALHRGRTLPSLRGPCREHSVPSEIGCATDLIVVQRGKIWDSQKSTLFSSNLLSLLMYNSTIKYFYDCVTSFRIFKNLQKRTTFFIQLDVSFLLRLQLLVTLHQGL